VRATVINGCSLCWSARVARSDVFPPRYLTITPRGRFSGASIEDLVHNLSDPFTLLDRCLQAVIHIAQPVIVPRDSSNTLKSEMVPSSQRECLAKFEQIAPVSVTVSWLFASV